MGEHKHEAFLTGSDGSWLLMPRCKGICRWGGWLREPLPMQNSRKTHDASSRATALILVVSRVIFPAAHSRGWGCAGRARSSGLLAGLWGHRAAAPWDTAEQRPRWHTARPLQELWFTVQPPLRVSFSKTFCLWYRGFVLLMCPFSYSFGGKAITFQTFKETHFQSIVHYQGDT